MRDRTGEVWTSVLNDPCRVTFRVLRPILNFDEDELHWILVTESEYPWEANQERVMHTETLEMVVRWMRIA